MCCCRQAELADVKNFNFDHPDAFDTPALLECVVGLKEGRPVEVPSYDFSTHRRSKETKRVSKGHRPQQLLAAAGWVLVAVASCGRGLLLPLLAYWGQGQMLASGTVRLLAQVASWSSLAGHRVHVSLSLLLACML